MEEQTYSTCTNDQQQHKAERLQRHHHHICVFYCVYVVFISYLLLSAASFVLNLKLSLSLQQSRTGQQKCLVMICGEKNDLIKNRVKLK